MPVRGLALGQLLTPMTPVGASGDGVSQGMLALGQARRQQEMQKQQLAAQSLRSQGNLDLQRDRLDFEMERAETGRRDAMFANLSKAIASGDGGAIEAAKAELARNGFSVGSESEPAPEQLQKKPEESTFSLGGLGGLAGRLGRGMLGMAPEQPSEQPGALGGGGALSGGPKPAAQASPAGSGRVVVRDQSGKVVYDATAQQSDPSAMFAPVTGAARGEEEQRAARIGEDTAKALIANGMPPEEAYKEGRKAYEYELSRYKKMYPGGGVGGSGGGVAGVGPTKADKFAAQISDDVWKRQQDTFQGLKDEYKLGELQQMEHMLNNITAGSTSDDALAQLSALQSFIKAFNGARPTDADFKVVDNANGMLVNLENQIKRLGPGGRADAQMRSLENVAQVLRGQVKRVRLKAGEKAERLIKMSPRTFGLDPSDPAYVQEVADLIAYRVSGIYAPKAAPAAPVAPVTPTAPAAPTAAPAGGADAELRELLK